MTTCLDFSDSIVKPDFRGRGFGVRIWEKAPEYLGGRNIGLIGVIARKADYEKYGFQFAYRNLRFAGHIKSSSNSDHIINLNDIELDRIVEYDNQTFPAKRREFISRWVCQKDCKALGYTSGGRLAGYGVLRPCVTGFKIGPLFADSREIAQELLAGLGSCVSGEIFIDVPEQNQQAVDLVEKSEMKQVFETARMYSKNIPHLPVGKIYGVTTLELG